MGSEMCIRDSLKDDAPGDAELGVEYVGAGGKDYAADGGIGECTGQAGDGAHRGLQRTAVARPRAHDGCEARELSPVLLAARGRSCRGHHGDARRPRPANVGNSRSRDAPRGFPGFVGFVGFSLLLLLLL